MKNEINLEKALSIGADYCRVVKTVRVAYLKEDDAGELYAVDETNKREARTFASDFLVELKNSSELKSSYEDRVKSDNEKREFVERAASMAISKCAPVCVSVLEAMYDAGCRFYSNDTSDS